ncbi:MAG TPA: SWIM zinc finger family protein, partial [Terracidiphilus sp.]
GSGATPYRVTVSEKDDGYKCTCPSRKFPCKHSLALMWMRSEGKTAFAKGQAPEWVLDWVKRRRSAAGSNTRTAPESEPGEVKSIAQALAAVDEPPDPKAEARAAAAREKNRREREEAILAGLDDLDLWLEDQIAAGLAGFATRAANACRLISQRLVDAKAPGLASRVEALPGRLFALSERQRGPAAVEELGQLHLLTEAYRHQQKLPVALQADVRREIGWAQSREALLDDPAAICATGRLRVVATLSEVQPDRLRRLETWLWREGPSEGARFAVLVDYVPVATGPARSPYSLGERLEATLVYYPSPVPLRAQLATVAVPAHACTEPLIFEDGLGGQLDAYEHALSAKPWLGAWPIGFRGARMQRNGERLFVCEAGGPVALPLASAQTTKAAPLLSLDRFDGVGLWNGYSLRLGLAQTELGRWEDA